MTETLLKVTGLSTHYKTRRGVVVAVNALCFSLLVSATLKKVIKIGADPAEVASRYAGWSERIGTPAPILGEIP
jgi:hypothetical protein